MKKAIIIILSLVMIMSFAATAYADTIFTAEITGSHRIENNTTLKTGRHTFVLTAINGAPMPEGSVDGVKKVTISSGEKFSFGPINYEKPGIYEYQISRELIKSESLIEDDSKYRAQIAVFSDYTSVVVINKVGASGKTDKIEYVDKYIEKDTGSTKPQTGDSNALTTYAVLFGAALICLLVYIIVTLRKDKE